LTLPEPQYLDMPAGFQTMRRIRITNVPNTANHIARLKFATGAQIDDLRTNTLAPGVPIWFALFANEIELCPTPDFAYTVEMVYRTLIPPLGVNLSNWLLTMAPDAYLYGALMEAAPYLHDDDRIAVWASGVQSALDDINKLSDEALFNAGPLVIRRKGSGYG
jgi:hypothetical protein